MCFYFLIISRWLYSLSLFFCYFVQKCFICCNALLWNLEWWIDPTEHFFCNALCFSLCVPLVTQQYIKNSLWRSDFCVDFCTACRQMFDSPCACVPWRLLVGLRRSTRYHYSSQFHQSGVCIFRFSSVIVCVFFSSRFFNTLLFGARRTQKEDGERKIEQEGFPMQKGRIEHGSHLRFQIQVEWWKWQILSSSAPPGTTNCSWRTRLLVSLPSVWSEKAWSLVGISHWKLMKIFTLDLSLSSSSTIVSSFEIDGKWSHPSTARCPTGSATVEQLQPSSFTIGEFTAGMALHPSDVHFVAEIDCLALTSSAKSNAQL